LLWSFTESSEQQAISRTTTVVLVFFFLSLLGIGMGRTAVETLGIPYMDDNVANRESPTYFGINLSLTPSLVESTPIK
jgi:hypothetical protein